MENISESLKPVDLPIVFILAKGRSGSTLLQIMLDSHPNIIAPFESRFVLHFKNRYSDVTQWNEKIKKSFLQDIYKEAGIYFFWEMNKDLLEKRILDLPEKINYGDVCKQVYSVFESMHPKAEAQLIVDKNPVYTMLLPHVTSIYPNAKFIHLVRDYRANANSVHQVKTKRSMENLGYKWLMENEDIENLKAEKPNNFITVTYEALLSQPKKVLTDITDFLGLNYSESMLTYHERSKNVLENYVAVSENEEIKHLRALLSKTIHKNLSRPIDASLKDSWKEKLNETQIETLEEICGDFGKKYDYIPLYTKPTHKKVPLSIWFYKKKLQVYYNLPIWLRELKSKPDFVLMPDDEK